MVAKVNLIKLDDGIEVGRLTHHSVSTPHELQIGKVYKLIEHVNDKAYRVHSLKSKSFWITSEWKFCFDLLTEEERKEYIHCSSLDIKKE